MIVKALREGLGRLIVLFDWLTRPRKMQRTESEQRRVTEQSAGLSLYQFYACPFCVKTRRAIHRLNLPIIVRDAKKGSKDRDILASGGGKIKVPCLRIDNENETTWLYESNAIIDYLEHRFGRQATEK